MRMPAALLAVAVIACGEDGTHVRRSPGEEAPPLPPPSWCSGADPKGALSALGPAVLEPVPVRSRGTLCPRGTERHTRPVDDAGEGFGTQYWCERDGVRHGRWDSYWSDGSLHAQRAYVDGVPNGVWRAWYPNGDLEFEHRYERGALHGAQLEYYPEHQKRIALDYEDGQPAGIWRYWNLRGDVVCQRTF